MTREELWRALRTGLLVGVWVGGPIFTLRQFTTYGRAGAVGGDAHAYWLTAHQATLYTGAPGTRDAFLYSPAFAQAIHPLAQLPFSVFAASVIAVDVACVAWLLAPLGWKWAVPLLLMVPREFVLGNVYGILAASVVIALMGRPGWWALGWLTKITQGTVGFTWHAARFEWRSAATGASWAAGVAALSFFWSPTAWREWFTFLHSAPGATSAEVRLLVALALTVIGARRGWWWTVPVTLVISAPVVGAKNLVYLTCLPRLARQRSTLGVRPGSDRSPSTREVSGRHPSASDTRPA